MATTVPARSDPGVKGNCNGRPRPVSITILSRWFNATAATLTRTSPGRGCGIATSRNRSASRPIPPISHLRMLSAMSPCNQARRAHIPRGSAFAQQRWLDGAQRAYADRRNTWPARDAGHRPLQQVRDQPDAAALGIAGAVHGGHRAHRPQVAPKLPHTGFGVHRRHRESELMCEVRPISRTQAQVGPSQRAPTPPAPATP